MRHYTQAQMTKIDHPPTVITKFQKQVGPIEDMCTSFVDKAKTIASATSNIVLSDQARTTFISRDEILHQLKQLLYHTGVRLVRIGL